MNATSVHGNAKRLYFVHIFGNDASICGRIVCGNWPSTTDNGWPRIARHPTTPAPRSGCQKAPTHRSNLGRPNRPIPEGDFYHSLGLPKRSVGYPRSATPHGASFLKGMSMGTCVGLTLMNTTSIAPVAPSTRPSQGDKWCRTTNKGS
jgi:hypothetical protein